MIAAFFFPENVRTGRNGKSSSHDAAGFCYALREPKTSSQAMKYLLWIGLLLIVFWIVRRTRRPMKNDRHSPTAHAPEEMVTCAHCGVYLPISDSIEVRGRRFCSIEHQRAAQTTED